MLWIIGVLTAVIGVHNLAMFLFWGWKYIIVHKLNRGGTWMNGFGIFAIKAVAYIVISIICFFALKYLLKRVKTIKQGEIYNKVIKFEEKMERHFLVGDELYYYWKRMENNQIVTEKARVSICKIFVDDIDEITIMYTEEIDKSPTLVEIFLTFIYIKSETIEIHVPKDLK